MYLQLSLVPDVLSLSLYKLRTPLWRGKPNSPGLTWPKLFYMLRGGSGGGCHSLQSCRNDVWGGNDKGKVAAPLQWITSRPITVLNPWQPSVRYSTCTSTFNNKVMHCAQAVCIVLKVNSIYSLLQPLRIGSSSGSMLLEVRTETLCKRQINLGLWSVDV